MNFRFPRYLINTIKRSFSINSTANVTSNTNKPNVINDLSAVSLATIRERLNQFPRRRIKPAIATKTTTANNSNTTDIRNSTELPIDRRAAVIILLCHSQSIPSIAFTKRQSNLRLHSGEVSFVGGLIDSTIDTDETTAGIREMNEELGLLSTDITVLGIHHDAKTIGSNTVITPIIAYLHKDLYNHPNLNINPIEVDYIFSVPLKTILSNDPAVHITHKGYPAINYKPQLPIPTATATSASAPATTTATTTSGCNINTNHSGNLMIWGATSYLLNQFKKDILIGSAELKSNKIDLNQNTVQY